MKRQKKGNATCLGTDEWRPGWRVYGCQGSAIRPEIFHSPLPTSFPNSQSAKLMYRFQENLCVEDRVLPSMTLYAPPLFWGSSAWGPDCWVWSQEELGMISALFLPSWGCSQVSYFCFLNLSFLTCKMTTAKDFCTID